MEIEYFKRFGQSSFSHWWFQARSVIVKSLLDVYLKVKKLKWLDIGAGYGSMLEAIQSFTDELDVIEPYKEARIYLEKNFEINRVFSFNFPEQIPEEKYSVVSMFDVLEHIEDDIKALRIINEEVLEKDGYLILTVPAYNWLWSSHDELSGHFRRYTRKDLMTKLNKTGFKIIKATYFNTLLFPVAVISRVILKFKKGQTDLKMMPSFINSIFFRIFSLESLFLKRINFPFGLSIFIIAKPQ